MSEDLFSTNCFITMVLARYSPTQQQLVYANAGHIYPMVWSHKQIIEKNTLSNQKIEMEPNYLTTRGVPVGILPVWKAKAGEIDLESGDIFLLTSDGITEATVIKELTTNTNLSSNSMLNQEGLWQLICQESKPFDLTNLLTRFREYTNKVQEDDQTILSLEVL